MMVPIYDPITDTTYHTLLVQIVPSSSTTDYRWNALTDYPVGAIVTNGDKVWESIDTPNEGNVPVEGGGFWEERSKSKSGFVYWVAGVFTDDQVFVLYTIAGDTFFYELTDITRPYLSTDFEAELAANKWRRIGTIEDILGTVLVGLSTASTANVTAADTILSAIGKLQANKQRTVFTDGSAAMAANLDLNNNKILQLAAATGNGEAVNFEQLNAAIDGLKPKDDARAATTGALPAYTPAGLLLVADVNGFFPDQDGITLILGDYLLVKDEAGADKPYNGIYELTDIGSLITQWVLTRRADADSDIELQGAFVQIEEGTVNEGTAWVQYTVDVDLGTSDILWRQISSSVPDATPTTKGKAKLFTTFGTGTDGSISQLVVTRGIQDNVTAYGEATGVDDYEVELDPTLPAYVAGQTFQILFADANIGPVTIDIDGLGPLDLKKNVDEDLIADDIKDGQILNIAFDGVNFQVIGGSVAVATPTLAGISKLYDSLGANEDGSINQKIVTDNLALKEVLVNKATGTGSLSASDTTYPSENKVKANLDLKEDLANKATGTGALSTSDTLYPTENKVKANIDAKVEDALVDGVTTKAPSQNIVFDELALKAPLASPTFTGTPIAPTAGINTNTTQIATTAFVRAQIDSEASIANVGAKLYLFNKY